VFQKKEGITRIRRDTLTIHQERRYLSAMHISKNERKSTILIHKKCSDGTISAFLPMLKLNFRHKYVERFYVKTQIPEHFPVPDCNVLQQQLGLTGNPVTLFDDSGRKILLS
jgi:hypothetical protein